MFKRIVLNNKNHNKALLYQQLNNSFAIHNATKQSSLFAQLALAHRNQQQQHRFYSATASTAATATTATTTASTTMTSPSPVAASIPVSQTPVNTPTAAESLLSPSSARMNNNNSSTPLPLQDHMKDLDASLDALVESQFEEAENLMDSFITAISPARYLTEFMTAIHDTTGLPWWLTIAATAFMARVAMVKLNINTTKFSMNKAAHIQSEKKLMERVRNAVTTEERVEASHSLREFKQKHGIEDWRMFSSFLQFPVFITFLYTLRQMAQLDPSMTAGGFLWFHDLSQVDPYMVLPILSACTQLLSFEVNNLKRFQAPGATTSTPQVVLKYFMRSIAILGIFFTKNFPAAMFMYWIPSNIFMIIYTYITKTEWFRNKYNIPKPQLPSAQDAVWTKKTEEVTKKNAKKFLPKVMYGALFPESAAAAKEVKAFSQRDRQSKGAAQVNK